MGVGTGTGTKLRDGSASDPPRRRPIPASPPLHELPVRTVTMVRGPQEGPGHGVQGHGVQGHAGVGHGFGICVKGGAKDTGGRDLW